MRIYPNLSLRFFLSSQKVIENVENSLEIWPQQKTSKYYEKQLYYVKRKIYRFFVDVQLF